MRYNRTMNTADKKMWGVIALIALGAGIFFIFPFIGVIAIAALMAFLFFPLYSRMRKLKPVLAAVLTLIISFFVVAVPLAFVITVSAGQIAQLTQAVIHEYGGSVAALPEFVTTTINGINAVVAPFNGDVDVITGQGIIEFIRTTLPDVLRNVSTILIGFVGSIPLAIILTIIYVTLFIEFLLYGRKIKDQLLAISPLSHSLTQQYLTKIGLMAQAMTKGHFLISAIISALSALLLIPLGLGQYYFVFFVIFTVLNLIPLGCGILLIPMLLVAMATGQFWIGLLMLVLYIIISNLDSVLRPRFVPKGAELSGGLTLIATFSGLAYFGLLGVVYGPIIMIVIVTTLKLYAELKSQTSRRSRLTHEA